MLDGSILLSFVQTPCGRKTIGTLCSFLSLPAWEESDAMLLAVTVPRMLNAEAGLSVPAPGPLSEHNLAQSCLTITVTVGGSTSV